MMKPINEIAQEFKSNYEEADKQRVEKSGKKEETFNLLKMLGHHADYLVESLETDNKREITNLPKVQEIKGEVSEKNSKGILGYLGLIYDRLKAFSLPDVFNIKGTVKVENQVVIPDVKIPEYPKQIKTDVVTMPKYIKETLQNIVDTLKTLDLRPQVNVESPKVEPKVEIDVQGIKDALETILKALNQLDIKPEVNIDTDSVKKAVDEVKSSIDNLRFPVPNFQSSWQHSIEMQSKDKPKQFAYTTVAGVKVISTITMTGNDGATYVKTFSYTLGDPNNPDADSGWVKQ